MIRGGFAPPDAPGSSFPNKGPTNRGDHGVAGFSGERRSISHQMQADQCFDRGDGALLFALFNRRRSTLHDVLTGVLMLRRPNGARTGPDPWRP